jgi:hypothetical protein
MVAGSDRRDVLADALDDAGALVSEHGRRIAGRIRPRGGVQIGVAHAAGDEPHERLARSRVGELDVLDAERRSELLEHCGAHPHGRSSSR